MVGCGKERAVISNGDLYLPDILKGLWVKWYDLHLDTPEKIRGCSKGRRRRRGGGGVRSGGEEGQQSMNSCLYSFLLVHVLNCS